MSKLNKKGMEMSVNALVGIIIGLLLFGTATTIFFNIFNEASDTPTQVDDRIRQSIIDRFDASQKVFIPTTSKTLDRSDRQATFYVAVRNLEDVDKEFKIEVNVDDESEEVEALYLDTLQTIERGSTHIFIVLVEGTEMEAYQTALTVTVKDDEGNEYGNKQVIRVNR